MSEPDRDERLAGLLVELTETYRGGHVAKLDELTLAHPDLAEELRELWDAVWVVEEFGKAYPAEKTSSWTSGIAHHDMSNTPLQGYELLEEIGRGGMGVVYRAVQSDLQRTVALKMMRNGGVLTSPSERGRFLNEAVAQARLQHPNIVSLYGVGTEDGASFITMQLIEGSTLANRLADGPLPDLEAARILLPVCRALQYAHEQGVLHRDLKPSNILIDSEGRPLVSDFGLAKRVDATSSLTPSGAILGTPGYMAPEQAAASRGVVGPRTDVYGLGAILYQMLTGRPPFLAATPFDTLLLVLEQDPVAPRALNPRASADLEMLALKCLQKDPGLRYQSASALAEDLQAFLNGETVSARSTGLIDLVARLLGETHHADVLENWGGLWMMHSAALFVFFGTANLLLWRGVTSQGPYLLIFTVGMGIWASIFWALRRRGGPISFIERLLAHVWGAGIVAINLTFVIEWLMGLPAWTLSPVFGITNGMLFMIKGGILAGSFYFQAAAVFLTIPFLVWFPRYSPLIMATVSGTCFFITGLKAFRRGRKRRRLASGREN